MKNYPHIVRGKKPYQSFLFRCIVPKDLISVLGQVEFRVSLGNSLYSHSKIISTNLYNLSQFIFREIRDGYMKDITLEDVKNILRVEVRKSLYVFQMDSSILFGDRVVIGGIFYFVVFLVGFVIFFLFSLNSTTYLFPFG